MHLKIIRIEVLHQTTSEKALLADDQVTVLYLTEPELEPNDISGT